MHKCSFRRRFYSDGEKILGRIRESRLIRRVGAWPKQAFRSLKSKGAAHRARFRIVSWKGKRYRHILSGIGADAHRSHNVEDLLAQKGPESQGNSLNAQIAGSS